MKIYSLNKKRLKEVNSSNFKLEKDIQSLVETNLDELFGYQLIQSEFVLGGFRLDSLCYDKSTNSVVIIEYKRGKSYSVIDQGYTYLQLLLNNKADFLLILSQHLGKVLKQSDVDWSQSRIIFISQAFNSYQKDSVNFKNLPFELFEIKKFENIGANIGLRFQVADDVIDYQGNSYIAGKKTGKDAKKGKATLISLLGYKSTIKYAKNLNLKINKQIKKYGSKSKNLSETLDYILYRSK